MSECDEYIVHGEPRQKEKADNWQTAIGLHDMDGLKDSPYLLDATLNKNLTISYLLPYLIFILIN